MSRGVNQLEKLLVILIVGAGIAGAGLFLYEMLPDIELLTQNEPPREEFSVGTLIAILISSGIIFVPLLLLLLWWIVPSGTIDWSRYPAGPYSQNQAGTNETSAEGQKQSAGGTSLKNEPPDMSKM